MICRIIVSALEVVESRLGIVVVASVAEGVTEHEVGGVCRGIAVGISNGNEISPGIVGVMAHPENFLLFGSSVLPGKEDSFYISLGVNGVVVLGKAAAAVLRVPEAKGGTSRPLPVAETGRRVSGSGRKNQGSA